MDIGFGEALLLLGVVLGVGAALSGVFHRTVLSLAVVSVGAGLVFSAAGVVSVDPDSRFVIYAVELALILTLFSDGLFVERELLRNEWHAPARALAIAMPITLVLLALAAKILFPELSWVEAFLLGAVLSPTDPVVTSAVVTAQRVPSLIRHTLNLESGLNDGLALPFVLFFLALASAAGSAGSEAARLLGEAVVGGLVGIVLALLAGRLLPRLPGGGVTLPYEGMYSLGIGLAAFGLADVTYGNGLIAAFVAGIALAVARHDIPETFMHFNESVSAAFQVITFFVFGALIVATGWHGNAIALAAFIAFALLVARPAAVFLSFLGLGLPRYQQVFVAWFGPKGVASMLFALFVLSSTVANGLLVFEIAAFVVLASIMAHGLTDTVGAGWIERRIEREEREARGAPAAAVAPTPSARESRP